MKFPFSLFGKRSQAAPSVPDAPAPEPAPFPVERAVAQVQAETGMRFGLSSAQPSELQEAAAVLSVVGYPSPVPGTVIGGLQSESPVPLAPVQMAVPPPPPPPPPPSLALVAKEGVAVMQTSSSAPAPTEVSANAVVGRDEVIAAYRLFLRRDPESDAVIAPRLGLAREQLLRAFMVSPEFLQRAGNVKLVLDVAKAWELRQSAAATPNVPVMTQADVDAAKRIFWPEPHDQAVQPQPGQTADRTLSQLMRSEHFQKNEFNAQLMSALAKQIAERLSQK